MPSPSPGAGVEEEKPQDKNDYMAPDFTVFDENGNAVALSSFFASIIVANTEVLHSALIWKAALCCILMAVLGIGIAVIVQKFVDRRK